MAARGLLWHFIPKGAPRAQCGRSQHSQQRDVFATSDAAEFRRLPVEAKCRRCVAALDNPAPPAKRPARTLFVVEGVNRNGAEMTVADCTAADVRFWRTSQSFTVTAIHPQGPANG